MATSATWIVSNPTVGHEYIAPSAYWVIPSNGTSVTVTVQAFNSSGNLTSVSSLTAIRRNISSGSDQGSFTYNGGNGATSTGSSGTTGSAVFAPAGKVGSSCAQLRMYISYTGRAYDQPPSAPGNLAPSGTITTLTPAFSGAFSDPTSGDTLAQYEIVVNSASNGGGSQIWDSGNVAASSSETSAGAFSRAYGGSALAWASNYSVRARVANQHGNWGPWSGWVNFATVQGPDTPSVTSPTGTQTTLTPTLSFGYTSPAATAMASYHYTITAQGSGALVYDSGSVSHALASGGSVSVTIPSGAKLRYGSGYTLTLTVTDTNGATSGAATSVFSIASLPQVAPSTPVGGATVTTQTPTLKWTYSSASQYAQAQAQIEVQNAATSVDLILTGWLSQSAAQWTVTTSIAYGTQIRWRVQVQDSAGLGSGWSAWAYAYVNNAPSASVTAPTNHASVGTVTPTVTWTYTASSGGQAQASAQITVSDASGNLLATYSVSGAGASYTLPAGLLVNNTTYQLVVSVTDTNSVTGQSAIITFSVVFTPPADMAGQPLATATNYLLDALLNTDANADGVADNWTGGALSAGATGQWLMDTSITQPLQLASGDGPIMGTQSLIFTGGAGMTTADTVLQQPIPVANTPWVAGTTVLSLAALVRLQINAGAPFLSFNMQFLDGTLAILSQVYTTVASVDTGGQFVRYSIANNLVPAGTIYIRVNLRTTIHAGDDGQVWMMDAQLEAAAANDPSFIEGSLGPGYSYDAHGFSVRTQIAGGVPALIATPGADTDPVNGYGGSLALTWDTTLADSRFTAYLIERRRQDQASDDSAWAPLATLTNAAQSSYTDYTAASQTAYQYAVRQQIVYSDGEVGVSQHRAIAVGSVNFSPAWYLANAGQAGAPIYNMRLRYVQAKRTLQWQERATYSAFLGRVGAARDAGAPAGYTHTLVCYFTELRGDSRLAIRRQLVTMQRLGGTWYLKDPSGLAVPVFIQNITFDDEATYSETVLTATLALLQAADTTDY